MMQLLIVGLVSVVLHSCMFVGSKRDQLTSAEAHSQAFLPTVFADLKLGYEVTIPPELSRWTRLATGMDSAVSYPFFETPKGTSAASRVIIYDTSAPCSPSVMGTLQTSDARLISNEVGVWGRVNVWDYLGIEGWEPPFDLKGVLCNYDGLPQSNSLYSFCSERDDIAVVICLFQTPDDPKGAKEFFRTFRWSE